MRAMVAFSLNSEQNSTYFEIPNNNYGPAIEGSLALQPEIKEGRIIEFDQISEARLEVEKSYNLPLTKAYEQIDESIFDEMLDRGQQIKDARLYYLESNLYKYPVKGQAFTKKVINKIKNSFYEPNTEDDLIEKEREIGARIFQIPGFTFFMTDSKHWWSHYEKPESGKTSEVTTHYEVMLMATKANVLKCSSEIHERNEFIAGEELKNLNDAIKMYHKLVLGELYGIEANSADIDNNLE